MSKGLSHRVAVRDQASLQIRGGPGTRLSFILQSRARPPTLRAVDRGPAAILTKRHSTKRAELTLPAPRAGEPGGPARIAFSLPKNENPPAPPVATGRFLCAAPQLKRSSQHQPGPG